MAKPALGRGLGALLGSSASPVPPEPVAAPSHPIPDEGVGAPVRRVALDEIRACRYQPRQGFADGSLRDLAESIRAQGVVQPLLVRRVDDGYELIAGERRWRAARVAGLTEVPVIVRDADDRGVLELALIENLQREDLNAIEEAQGYARLIEQFKLTQEEVAARVGKSRAVVANALRLLKLAPELQAHVRDDRLSVGHAKVLLGLPDAERQVLAADRVLRHSLNVRQTEELVGRLQGQRPGRSTGGAGGGAGQGVVDPHIDRLQTRLRERLGTKVQLRYRQGKGALQIQFFSDDDLDRVLGLLGIPPE
jgi:ParB family transcriptional regulator, chromosome partitioning protein